MSLVLLSNGLGDRRVPAAGRPRCENGHKTKPAVSSRDVSERGWKAVALDEVEARPWLGTELACHPLREALGARIVGMSAYTAERAGQEVVDAHRETEGGRGHEEV
jgi:hypothetical protein